MSSFLKPLSCLRYSNISFVELEFFNLCLKFEIGFNAGQILLQLSHKVLWLALFCQQLRNVHGHLHRIIYLIPSSLLFLLLQLILVLHYSYFMVNNFLVCHSFHPHQVSHLASCFSLLPLVILTRLNRGQKFLNLRQHQRLNVPLL